MSEIIACSATPEEAVTCTGPVEMDVTVTIANDDFEGREVTWEATVGTRTLGSSFIRVAGGGQSESTVRGRLRNSGDDCLVPGEHLVRAEITSDVPITPTAPAQRAPTGSVTARQVSCGSLFVRVNPELVVPTGCSGIPQDVVPPGTRVPIEVAVSNNNPAAIECDVGIRSDGTELGRSFDVDVPGETSTAQGVVLSAPAAAGEYELVPFVDSIGPGEGRTVPAPVARSPGGVADCGLCAENRRATLFDLS